jgi:hypothetical protein
LNSARCFSDGPIMDCANPDGTTTIIQVPPPPPPVVYSAPPPPVIVTPPPPVVLTAPPPPPQPGLNYTDPNGIPRHFEQGTFLKADDGQVICAIWDQQFHAFSSWDSFLRHGGKSDLSNVVRWSTLSNWPSSSFGAPVPN